MTTAKDNAIGLYIDGIQNGRPREAVTNYTGDRYTQHSTGVPDGQDLCQVDLFRVDNGKIVEHWDNSEPVPPKSEWVNSGKF